MKPIINILLSIAICIPLLTQGQTERLTPTQEFTLLKKRISVKALQLLLTYETVSNLNRIEYTLEFQSLFTENEATVQNDIMPYNRLEELTNVSKYIKIFQDKYFNYEVTTRVYPIEIRFNTIDNNGQGTLEIDFIKTILATPFQSGLIYNDTFDFTAKIEFNFESDSYHFTKIQFSRFQRNTGRYLFIRAGIKSILSKPEIYKNIFLINGHLTDSAGENYNLIKYWKPGENLDVRILSRNGIITRAISGKKVLERLGNNTNSETSNTIQTNFILPWKELTLVSGINANARFLNNDRNINSFKISGGKMQMYGIGLGLTVYEKKSYSISLQTGISNLNTAFTVTSDNLSETFTYKDSAQTEHLRTSTLTNFNEHYKISGITIPILFNLNINLGNKTNLTFGGGLNVLLITDYLYSAISAANYSGYYENLFKCTFNENGIYDFGNFNLQSNGKAHKNTGIYGISYQIGLSRKLTNRFWLSTGISVTQYRNPINKIDHEKYISRNYTELESLSTRTEYSLSTILPFLQLNCKL